MSAAAVIDNSFSNTSDRKISDLYIGNLCTLLGTVTAQTRVSAVSQMIRSNPSIPGFCIIENDMLVGVATKNQMNAKLSSQYGYNLYCNKGIETIMSKDFLCVDFFTTIDIVVKIAMQRDPDRIYDFITVTKDGKYSGIVTVKDLLEKSIQMEIVHTKHASPIKALAGIPCVQKQAAAVSAADRSCILDFDIDNFKSYNDVYGSDRGDMVMQSLMQILKNNIPDDCFVGHQGEDDLITVASSADADIICRRVIEEFERLAPGFYSESDLSRGYIVSRNCYGIEEVYPLMSIIIAGMPDANEAHASEAAGFASVPAGYTFVPTGFASAPIGFASAPIGYTSGTADNTCKIKSICM